MLSKKEGIISNKRETINEEKYVRDLALRLGIRTHFVRPTRLQFPASLSPLPVLIDPNQSTALRFSQRLEGVS